MNTQSFRLLLTAAGLASASLGWLATGWWSGGSRPHASGAEAATRQALPYLGPTGGWERGYAAVAASGDPASQMAAAIEMASRIPPESFARFLENLRRLPAHSAQGMAKKTVLRRWIAHDPEAALAWCRQNSESDAAHDVVEEWACLQPARASEILQSLPASERAAASTRIFAGLVRSDREAAMKWLADMAGRSSQNPSSEWSSRSFGMPLFRAPIDSLRDLARQDPAWLLERSEGLPDHLRQAARAAVAQSLSGLSTQTALDWINTQPDRLSLLEGLMHRPRDEAALFAAVASLSPDEQKQLPMYTLSSWGTKDPKSLVDSLDAHAANLNESLKRQLQASLPRQLAASDSPGDLANRLLANPALRQGFGIDSFALAWANKDPAAAGRWVAALANPDERRLAEIAMQFAGADAADAPPASLRDQFSALAENSAIPQGSQLLRLSADDRVALLNEELARRSVDQGRPTAGTALGTMANHFPAETARWLQQTVTPENSQAFLPSLARVAARWAAEEPSAAAQWAVSLPAGEPRAWAAANVAARWARFDEESARRWVATLPAAEQSIAARGLPEPK